MGIRLGLGWSAVLVAVTLVAAGACGGDDDDGGGATVPEDSAASSSTTVSSTPDSGPSPIDITTKPETVTVEYADAVMDELDRILSDAIRDFVAADGPTKAFDDKLNAVYDEPSLENQRQAYGRFARDGVDEFRKPPGDVITSVKEILKADSECVVLRTTRSFGEALTTPQGSADQRIFIALTTKATDSDPTETNGTPWSIVFDGDVIEGDDPTTAC